jgi:hypothetical protein
MTLLEEVIELDTMLANDGYKSWGYARLTLDKVIKALQAPPDVNPHVMQAEGSDVSEGAAVASEGEGEANTCAGCEHTHVLWINSDWKYFCLDCGAVNICG